MSSGGGPRRRITALSLRHQMSLAMAAFLVVILGLSLLLAHRILTRTAEEAAIGRLSRAAREVAVTIEAAMQQRMALLEQAATLPEVQRLLEPRPSAEAVEAAREVVEALRLPGGGGAEVWSRPGQRVASLQPRAIDTDPPIGSDQPVHGLLRGGGDVTTTWTAVPITIDGVHRGWFASEMRVGGPGDAERSLAELTGEELTLFLRNADGGFWSQQAGRPLEALPQPVSGAAYDLPDVGRALAGDAGIEGTPWVIVMMTPLQRVHERAEATVWRLGGASLLLLVAGSVLAWGFGAGITRPLVSLADAAEAMTSGDYTQRVAVSGGNELGSLAATFNHMAEQLEASRLELMQRVQEAQEARLEAERLRADADSARDHAEKANRAKGDFLAVVSHELRTPLNAIGGYTQLLELGVQGSLNEQQQAALRRISVNQEQLLALIDDVLSYAHIEARRVSYDIVDIPLVEVMGRIEASIAPQLAARGLTWAQQPVDARVSLRADAARVQQILLNLLANAVKFTAAGGHITVFCDADSDHVRIHVRDTGVGIPQEQLHMIFEPFVQAGRTHSNPAHGVGLGLSISRDLARGMGGDVLVTSAPGRGSIFTLVLPRGSIQPSTVAVAG